MKKTVNICNVCLLFIFANVKSVILKQPTVVALNLASKPCEKIKLAHSFFFLVFY